MVPPGGPPPTVPQGWQVTWSDQYNQWFFVNIQTGASQWEHPSGPAYASQPAVAPQPSYDSFSQPQYDSRSQQRYDSPSQPQYVQQGFAPPMASSQPAVPETNGIRGRFGNLDPKAKTALAVGGGLAAGAFLGHEIDEYSNRLNFSHHGEHHHHVLGSMAGLIGSAGAGALGARFFGRKGQAAQTAPSPPVPQAYPSWQPGAPVYPAQAPTPPTYPGQPMPPGGPSSGFGQGGLGQLAVGGAAGMAGALAMNGASNFLHHHQNQGGAPTTTGGSGGMGSFLGGLAYSGPRLHIHAAAFADKDVTNRVRELVTPEQTLVIEKMHDEFGDPWPEVKRKMFSVLYQYGDRPLEVLATSTSDGSVDIRDEALSNVRMAYINKDPGRIISLIWGSSSILTVERVKKLEKDGEMDCSGLGDGGYYPWDTRNLICYYRAPDGGFAIGHGREGGTMRLPWNPLAKWG